MVGIKSKWKAITGNTNIRLRKAVLLSPVIPVKKFHPVPYQVFSNKHDFQGENEMHRFLIIIEKGNQNYGAYSPDLPGCVAVGDTIEEVEKNMREAIIMHIKGMMEDQEPIPYSQTTAEYMEISIPDSAA